MCQGAAVTPFLHPDWIHSLQSSNQRGVTAWLWMSFQNLTQVVRTQQKMIFSPSGISRTGAGSEEGQLFSQANINFTRNISLSNGNGYRNSLTFQPSGAWSELRDVNSQGGFFHSQAWGNTLTTKHNTMCWQQSTTVWQCNTVLWEWSTTVYVTKHNALTTRHNGLKLWPNALTTKYNAFSRHNAFSQTGSQIH